MAYLANVRITESGSIQVVQGGVVKSSSAVIGATDYTPTLNTILYWPLRTTQITDASGNGYHGEIIGTTSIQPGGKFGDFLEFLSGSTTYARSLAKVPAFPSYTFSWWQKRYTNTPYGVSITAGSGDDAIGFSQCDVWFDPINRWGTYAFNTELGGDMTFDWTHFCVVVDQPTTSMTLYVNKISKGVLEDWSRFPTSFSRGIRIAGNPGGPNAWHAYIDGSLAEVIYENKAWSAAEVATYYDARV